MARHAGTYLLAMGARTVALHVFAGEGGLQARIGDGAPTRFRHESDHTFVRAVAEGIGYVFTVEKGRAVRVAMHQGSRTVSGTRQP